MTPRPPLESALESQAAHGSDRSSVPVEENWSSWIGKTEEVIEEVSTDRVGALAATLDIEPAPTKGAPLPAGWHWLFFNPVEPRRNLGLDGHPKRGGFLPPVSLPRRMWAGGSVEYLAPLEIGQIATRRSEILRVENKFGKRGQLVFVTVRHVVSCTGAVRLIEEQNLVYREATAGTSPKLDAAPTEAEFRSDFRPDPVLLFRYSALTFNGHRIHYDQPYAQQEEHYRDLVVHGPLTATLLQGFASFVCRPGRALAHFEFRGVSPLFVDRPFWLEANSEDADRLVMWARGPDGDLAMSARARFVSRSE
jgi:3-methylfumaryl-CoA hydratase